VAFLLIFRRALFSGSSVNQVAGQMDMLPTNTQNVEDKEAWLTNSARMFDYESLKWYEEAVRKDLLSQKIESDARKIEYLIGHLALAILAKDFECLNSVLYGNQVRLLEHLNSNTEGDTADNLKAFYSSASARYPSAYKNYSYDQYLDFLEKSQLITKKDKRYLISNLGRDYLSFLVKLRRKKPRF
jgi:hypothetical protein